MEILHVTNLTKTFDGIHAVDDLSFAIEKGTITALIGPNGSGKTTSIRMLLGLTRPQIGHVRVYGQDPFTNLPIKQNIWFK